MYLGIDLGTSSVKALLIDAEQAIVDSASAEVPLSRPHQGWSEQDPADWIAATEKALAALQRNHSAEMAAVRGIGLSGHMHGATLLGADNEVLRPCIMWNDVRSYAEAASLDADPRFRAITGNIVFPGFTAPKLDWVKKNEPDVFARVRKVLLPKDYLRFWLTGDHISEMSDAAGTSWLDTGARAWSPDQMPSLVEGSEPGGQLRAEIASRFGLPAGITVAGGAGDNAAAAIGMGMIHDGSAFASLGTSGVLFAANNAYLPNAESAVHAFCHALPNTWHQMGVILSATDSLRWYEKITGVDAAELTGALGETLLDPSGVIFLPYLGGERTPHNDASIRGGFAGLGHESGRDVLTRAVMEGVCFAFRDCLEALKEAGTSLDRATAVGGGSRSPYWLKLMATVLGVPVEVPAEGDFGAAFGAARLGLMAAEGADPASVCSPPAIEAVHEPDRNLEPAYADAYRRYRALYPAIKGVMS